MERLNKYLAKAGIASRREADLLIGKGRVLVNGQVVSQMGMKVNPEIDHVEIDGKAIKFKPEYEYLVLYKPPGFLSTVRDPFNRPTVMDLLPKTKTRLYPVGRLDLDTSGLMFFTNDGDLALALTHPRHLVEKVYLTKVIGVPSTEKFQALSRGVILEDGKTAPAKVALEAVENGNAIVRIVIREGRKRQIKRMMKIIGHPVLSLHREAVGPLKLGNLRPGEYRQPSDYELQELLKLKKVLGEER